MKINDSHRMNPQSLTMGSNQVADAESKNFQNQIANAQNQLQKISADNTLSPEEKAQKRQEIQKQIVELNNDLRKHQMELRRQQKQQKQDGIQEMLGDGQNSPSVEGNQTAGISASSMKAIISADLAMNQAKAQGGVSDKLEGRVRVLEGEIKQDAGRGGSTQIKQKEVEELTRKAENAAGRGMSLLSGAMQEMNQMVKEEGKTNSQLSSGEEKKTPKESSDAQPSVVQSKYNNYKQGRMFSDVDIHI